MSENAIASAASTKPSWRTPLIVILCGCVISLISLRPAFGDRPVHAADQRRQWLGPRRVRARLRVAESALGRRSAVRGRDCRPLRNDPRPVRRRVALRARPRADGVFHHAAHPQHHGRRADRLRTVRLLVQSRGRGARQAGAGSHALDRVRRGHGGGLLRAVPVRAARRRTDRELRLGLRALCICGGRLAGAAVLDRACDAARGEAHPAEPSPTLRNRCVMRCPKRSRTGPTCCWCSASSPAASSSPSSPRICRPIWSIAACRCRSAAGCSPIIGLFNIVGSLAAGWLGEPDAEALHACDPVFRARGGDRGLHHGAADARRRRSCSASRSD